jgi:hypothetical protein
MENRVFPWGHSRRYNAFGEYIKKLFGGRVQKLSIDAGFSCPNRSGENRDGGCTYCNNDAFNPAYCAPDKAIRDQIREGINFHRHRYRKARGFLAYFQAYSNTFAPIEILKERYSEALEQEGVVGLIIGTRPDCINDQILDYLAELREETYLTVEFGIESCYDPSLKRINRGHDFDTTVKAFHACAERNINAGGHMIIGLPGESRENIIEEASILSELPVNKLKFHQLQIVESTLMADEYRRDPGSFHFFSLEEYLDLMKDFIERLRPEIVIERIAGEKMPGYNAGPAWGVRYDQILKKFEEKLETTDSWQGKLYRTKNHR